MRGQKHISPRELLPALYIAKLIDALNERGTSTLDFLRKAGIRVQELRDPERLIHITRYIALLESVLAETESPGLGLQVGRRTTLREHGILGYAVLSSIDVREALRRVTRYIHLTGCLLHLELFEEPADTRLVVSSRPEWSLSGEAMRYLVEELIGNFTQWRESFGIESQWFSDIELAYQEPQYSDMYFAKLGCPVYFGQQETAIRLMPDVLDRHAEFDNVQISAISETVCELLSQDIAANAGLTAKIHRLLAFSPGAVPTMDKAAKELYTSIRTLRRRLHSENTTYQGVVSEFRMALAKSYLIRTALPATEVAVLVGYSEPVNFYRAFKQRFAISTKEFRELPIVH